MSAENNRNENIAPDVWRLFKKSKKKILTAALAMALLGAIFAITRPVQYQVEGTFREKGLKQANINSTLLDLLISGSKGGGIENEAVTILKSQKIIYPLISELDLQGKIINESDQDRYTQRIKKNALIEYAFLTQPLSPILSDNSCPLTVKSVHFQAEAPLNLKIVFPYADSQYQVLDLKGNLVGTGQLDHPFTIDENQFTLSCLTEGQYAHQTYLLTLWPLPLLTQTIKKNLRIENDHLDKNLLLINYRDTDRHFAVKFVNTLMDGYQNYLKDDHDRQAAIQLSYLKQKQQESEEHLQELMHKHAITLSEDLSSSGFADSKKEMEFLGNSQHEFKERLISNELEIKRLQNVQNGKCVYYDQYSRNAGDHSIINSVLEEIRDLKQQRDSLTLALKKSLFLNTDDLQNAFRQQQIELEEVQSNLQELNLLIEDFENGSSLHTNSKLFNDPRYLLQAWHQRLNPLLLTNGVDENEQFMFYLKNLKRLFSVHANIIRERLTHQQNPSLEYQGIQLDTARELYLNYSLKLNDLEAKKRENIFLINQMQDPNFEITSLSTILNDPVSNEMIQKASRLLLDLKDQNNRSDREQAQIREELNLERGFLLLHLQQTNQLVLLNQKLVEEKIYALQNITLELIHQQISVLEKNLHDYIGTRLDNLKQERLIIQQHMEQLHQEMATLPKRWASEKMIEQNLEINELIVQEVAKMVESKNISHKLELVQSAPVDNAIMPVHPLSSGLMLYSILGALIGGLTSFGFCLRKNLSEGFIASTFNLKQRKQYVAGRLPISNEAVRLETLRRLQGFLTENESVQSAQTLLLVQGTEFDYSADLANLLIKKGEKPIRLFLNFDRTETSNKEGLLQYLEGNTELPIIQCDRAGDFIEKGGNTLYANELLASDRFKSLLVQLQKTYKWVIAVSDALPVSALAENLLKLFPIAVVSVKEETIEQLKFYQDASDESRKKIAFIMTASDDVE